MDIRVAFLQLVIKKPLQELERFLIYFEQQLSFH